MQIIINFLNAFGSNDDHSRHPGDSNFASLSNKSQDGHPPTHTHTHRHTHTHKHILKERETVNENVSFKVMNLLVQIFGISLH
jgi:hypothetical protein